jgi:hypothetical protein
MPQYIDKSALTVEMELRKTVCMEVAEHNRDREFIYHYYSGKEKAYAEILEYLNKL